VRRLVYFFSVRLKHPRILCIYRRYRETKHVASAVAEPVVHDDPRPFSIISGARSFDGAANRRASTREFNEPIRGLSIRRKYIWPVQVQRNPRGVPFPDKTELPDLLRNLLLSSSALSLFFFFFFFFHLFQLARFCSPLTWKEIKIARRIRAQRRSIVAARYRGAPFDSVGSYATAPVGLFN